MHTLQINLKTTKPSILVLKLCCVKEDLVLQKILLILFFLEAMFEYSFIGIKLLSVIPLCFVLSKWYVKKRIRCAPFMAPIQLGLLHLRLSSSGNFVY